MRPTVEEPQRAQWDIVRVEVRQLVGEDLAAAPGKARKKLDDARKKVREFHGALCKVRVLDPACGSGNFLYVTQDILKRLESEVLALLEALGEKNLLLDVASVTVTPAQFYGIEKKRWAKEIAELVLWIGHLQWHARTRRNADSGTSDVAARLAGGPPDAADRPPARQVTRRTGRSRAHRIPVPTRRNGSADVSRAPQ